MNGNTERAQVPFLVSASLREKKRKAMERIKKKIKYNKISKKGNKIMPSGP